MTPRSRTLLVGGLLSGTSLDGIDALLLEVEAREAEAREAEAREAEAPDVEVPAPDSARPHAPARPGSLLQGWRVVAFRTVPWEGALVERMHRAMAPGGSDATELAALHIELGDAFARAFLALLEEAGTPPEAVAALGSHGQTIWHEPPRKAPSPRRGWTLQLGDPATLAEGTGIPVVSDFRSRDMAAGGEGAPLVPWADLHLLHRPGVGRAIQNLGGMGNVTFLPPDGDPHRVVAFDTGPGVALLDGAVRRATGGAERWDVEGIRGARGGVDEGLLASLVGDPFFAAPPPRSTGRERFGEARLGEIVVSMEADRHGGRGEGALLTPGDWDDLLATLTEFTARSVARSYRDHLPLGAVHEVVLAGGGARNPTLVRRIEAALRTAWAEGEGATAGRSGPTPPPVRTGEVALGIDPDAREAAAFALLAWAHLQGLPGNLPSATGAAGPRVLGSFTPGTRR